MSCQSGITANSELLNFFPQCKDGQFRLIQIKLINEELTLVHKHEDGNDWEGEYDHLILPLLNEQQPCYILYRMDSSNQLGFEWLFITWIPNNAHVREKMLYASTRATLRKLFGDALIKDEILGHHKNDIDFKGYLAHKKAKNAPPPRTMAEEEMEDVRKNELRETGLDRGQQTITGTEFQPSQFTLNELEKFANGSLDYVQLKLDINAEIVELSQSKDRVNPDQLQSFISQDEPLYHVYRFRHEFDGDSFSPTVFFYTYVGYKVSVKQRMLYSSCKAPLIQRIELLLGTKLDKKLELDASDSLTRATLMDEFHPPTSNQMQIHVKPKPPGKRGNMRLLE